MEREVGRAGADLTFSGLSVSPRATVVHLAEAARDAAADLGGYRRPAPVVHPGGLAEVAVPLASIARAIGFGSLLF